MNFLLSISRLLGLQEISDEVNEILTTWVGPLFIAIGGAGAIYIIVLAVQYIRSENDNKRAEIKTRLVNCIIGVVALLVLASLCITIPWNEVVKVFGYTQSKKATSMIGLFNW